MATLESHRNQLGGIALTGDLTLAHAQQLRASLQAALYEVDTLEVDLEHAERLDTAGVQVLLMLLREAAALGKTLRLCRPSANVRRVLGLLGLSSMAGSPSDPPASPLRAREA